jgi:hypothetical protein
VKGKTGALTHNFKKKYPPLAKHYQDWNGSFVFENSLLSPREKHRLASWKGVDETVRESAYICVNIYACVCVGVLLYIYINAFQNVDLSHTFTSFPFILLIIKYNVYSPQHIH